MLKCAHLVLLTIVCSVCLSLEAQASGHVLLNGKEIKTKDQLHELIARQLKFPGNYSKKLDGLYDTLSTDFSGESVIKIKNLNILKVRVGTDYVEAFVQAIIDAGDDNSRIILVME